ncbi:hypothetical protein ALQ62_200090 [Pseudomonas coronafaciens pv. zizaniae]|nr:hypothetical protein HBB04_05014 [Pseudomonas coronafaciens]RMN22765.1 hypothetical protein ALQ62_200090 [Pseudomonas coronafaciens pv. zizaniae]
MVYQEANGLLLSTFRQHGVNGHALSLTHKYGEY